MHVPRRLATMAGALIATLAMAGPAHAAAPGVNISDYADAQVALDAGAKQVRFFVRWRDFEPTGPQGYLPKQGAVVPNVFTRGLTEGVDRVLNAGATPILAILDAPAWAAKSGHPRSAVEYAAFVGSLAANLAPKRPTDGRIAYEIWNEPDAAEFWGSNPDPAAYTALLKASYVAIKAGDSTASVLTGPTTGNNFAWLEALYANGAQGFFDGVSVHTDTACSVAAPDNFYRDPDGRIGQYAFLGYREIHNTMLAHGDDKPIWMSELGWSSTGGGPGSCTRGASAGQKPSGVDQATQAQLLTHAFQCMAQDPYVIAGTVFTLRDSSAPGELGNYGLLGRDGRPKPSMAAFKQAGALGPGPCGDFDSPALTVIFPTPGQQYTDRLDLRASAVDTGVGLSRITYTYDGGQRIGSFADTLVDGKPFGLSPWFSSSRLPLGPHRIEVTARDKNGNQTTKAVDVTRVAPGALKGTLPVSVSLAKKVTCKKRVCTLKGALRGVPGGTSVGGKLSVQWQFKNSKGQYRTLSGGLAHANNPFAFTLKAKRAGRWRVRVVYGGVAPYKGATSKYRSFRVT